MRIILTAIVKLEREVDLVTADVKQSMIEELHDNPVGRFFDSQSFKMEKIVLCTDKKCPCYGSKAIKMHVIDGFLNFWTCKTTGDKLIKKIGICGCGWVER